MNVRTEKLDQIADVFSGHYERGAGNDDPAGTHRLVFIASIDPSHDHGLLRDRCPRFTPTKDPRQAVLQPGDLVVPARGDRLDVALIREAPDRRPLVAASFLHVIRPHADQVDPGYLKWWFSQPTTQGKLGEFIRGTKIPFLPLKATRTLKVPVPSMSVQRQIADFYQLVIRESEILARIRELRFTLCNAVARRVADGGLS